jgi:hypothetical protein
MSFLLLGEQGSPNAKFSRRKIKSRKPNQLPEATIANEDEQILGPLEMDAEEDNASDGSFASEMEWEGWDLDLVRQARLREDTTSSLQSARREGTRHTRIIRHRLMPTDLSPSRLSSPSSAESLGRRGREAAISRFGNPPTAAPILGSYLHTAYERERPYSPLSLEGTGASFEALSAMSPALLTAPSIMPLPVMGTTTSVISAGGVERARSLTAFNEDGRGLPRAMGVLPEGEVSGAHSKKVGKKGKSRKDGRVRASFTTSPTPRSNLSVVVPSEFDSHARGPSANTTQEQANSYQQWNAQASSSTTTVTVGGLLVPPTPDGIAEGGEKRTGKRGSRLMKFKPFSPDRLVKGLDSALNFVEGK